MTPCGICHTAVIVSIRLGLRSQSLTKRINDAGLSFLCGHISSSRISFLPTIPIGHFFARTQTGQGGQNISLCNTPASHYYCSSDRPGAKKAHDIYVRCRANYVVNYGPNVLFTAGAVAPFGWNSSGGWNNCVPYQKAFKDITDGTSKTLLMAEVRLASSDLNEDFRGDVFNDASGHFFMAKNTPNSGFDESDYCVSTSEMPCTPTNGSINAAAARSRHPNGVNAVMCDGSVRFFADSVQLATWAALSTMNQGDTIGGDQ